MAEISRKWSKGNAITLEDQTAKLRFVIETASEVWGRVRAGALD